MAYNYNEQLIKNITILQRNLAGLKDAVTFRNITKGQEAFMNVYLGIISDHINKSLDLLDSDKYREVLLSLED